MGNQLSRSSGHRSFTLPNGQLFHMYHGLDSPDQYTILSVFGARYRASVGHRHNITASLRAETHRTNRSASVHPSQGPLVSGQADALVPRSDQFGSPGQGDVTTGHVRRLEHTLPRASRTTSPPAPSCAALLQPTCPRRCMDEWISIRVISMLSPWDGVSGSVGASVRGRQDGPAAVAAIAVVGPRGSRRTGRDTDPVLGSAPRADRANATK
jgi:hypothetical protein